MDPFQYDLVLASRSERRRELLLEAGYHFRVLPPSESAECGVCSGESAPITVARLAQSKAADVVSHVNQGIVIGCDTVAEYQGQTLGKPVDQDHARQMLGLLRGTTHRVFSGLCVWPRPGDVFEVQVEVSNLRMKNLTDEELEDYLDTGLWEGKAGAFGLQDRLGWVEVVHGSDSNVVGLPLELLEQMLQNLSLP